ncbi:MAG: 1-acyl-sn-glycerol-3-phosphate acyltransferase, partial [Burkholderiales bacterium]|nr:1-acyl-sn-glycerol-3-phosphate acyltransferase [Burkholderiales bacterium]
MITSSPTKTMFRAVFHFLLRALARILFRLQVQGGKEIPLAGAGHPLLIIANHESFLDGILLGLFLPAKNPVFVVHTEVVRKRLIRAGLGWMADYLSVDPANPM